jgi:hypothetical protein
MTTRIGTGGPSTGVSTSASAARVTAPPAQPFKSVMSAGASAILSGAEQAVTTLPGGPILAAAIRPAPGDVGTSGLGAPAAPTVGVSGATGTASVTPEGTAGTAGAATATSGTAGTENAGIEAALNQSANQNLYFIEIQERMSAENRSYSAISNVLKARHDTVKNAIGNIR